MKFDRAEFRDFCKSLLIDSKEHGIVSLGEVWSGTQEYFIEEIAKGLEEDIHYFVVLKGRQVHITTVCLALDLYWSLKYTSVQGTLITDTEENREMFRETLAMYVDSLPAKWKRKMTRHNRTQLIFANRSRFMYQVAGTKKKEKRSVGVGKAVMMAHGTECSNWGDDGALADIGASLAKTNPRRLYIWESTARGMNGFQDMWETALQAYEGSRTQKAIFVGWWRNSLYSCKKGSPQYNVYWTGQPEGEEAHWIEEIKTLYDYDISDEQIAWWRWTLAEEQFELVKMYENYPPTETWAFQMSGSQFFTASILTDRMKLARSKAFDPFRVVFGATFAETQIIESDAKMATLKIWEKPRPNSYYALGCDPAFGSSEWADRFAIEVFRCYADGMEQVAEFCTEQCNAYQFAWMMLYLAGAYDKSIINLEINGPGMAVWQEILNMKRLAGSYDVGMNKNMYNVIVNIQNYLYRRPDSLNGNYNYHTKTTQMEKERFMNTFRDGVERGTILVHSTQLLQEAKHVQREEGVIGAPGRGKDDRVIAGGLAAIAWTDFIRSKLAQMRYTKAAAQSAEKSGGQNINPVGRSIQNWLKTIGDGNAAHPATRRHPLH